MSNGFQGKDGQKVPEMTDEVVKQISDRYIELYENILGEKFQRADATNVLSRVETNINSFLKKQLASKETV
jgi:phosphoribosylaminoimidazole-succinocarboxamide synthase